MMQRAALANDRVTSGGRRGELLADKSRQLFSSRACIKDPRTAVRPHVARAQRESKRGIANRTTGHRLLQCGVRERAALDPFDSLRSLRAGAWRIGVPEAQGFTALDVGTRDGRCAVC